MKERVWWVQPMGGCRMLYFVKSKNGTKCKNFAVLLCMFLCQHIHSFIFPEKGGYSPATAVEIIKTADILKQVILGRQIIIEWSAGCNKSHNLHD